MGATSGSAAIEIDRDTAAIFGHGHMGPSVDGGYQPTVNPGPIAGPIACQGELQAAVVKASKLIAVFLVKNHPNTIGRGMDPRLKRELIAQV